jgi:hypothetical protein
MTKNEVDKILSNSTQEQWIKDDETGSFTYKDDLSLRIQRANYETYEDFNEDWATNHPDKIAKSIIYTVYYNNSFIERKMLISLDGHRAALPLPRSAKDLTVTRNDVNFAKIVNINNTVDEYLRRSGISII